MSYHKHYGFALIRLTTDRPPFVACFSSEVDFAQDVFVLGRDKDFNLRLSDGRVLYKGPNIYRRHHYMHINGVVTEVLYIDVN